ncbi:hypothetical protein [Streptomyces sp. NPDC051219]|uniref:hypothetical protein n=1 Tax=Streptomyces sp. NPDC051219 TaxID=3155283 RepID=UPI00342D0EAA
MNGEFLATPDGYWPEEGVALEIDSAEYHFSRASRQSLCAAVCAWRPTAGWW